MSIPPPLAPEGVRRNDRRFVRLKTAIPAELRGRTTFNGEVADLSLGGCLVRSPVGPDEGVILDLRFTLGVEAFAAKVRVKEVSVDGSARDSGHFLLGLEFLRLRASDQDLLRHFLATETRRRRGASAPPA